MDLERCLEAYYGQCMLCGRFNESLELPKFILPKNYGREFTESNRNVDISFFCGKTTSDKHRRTAGSRGSELVKIKSRAHFFCMSCCFSYNCSVVSLTKNISEPMKHQLNRKILKYKRDSLRHSKAQKFLVQCLDAVFAF